MLATALTLCLTRPMTFAEWLAKSREQRSLSRERLGKLIGKSEPTIRRYETGERIPEDAVLERLSDVFRIEFIDLWMLAHRKTHKRVISRLRMITRNAVERGTELSIEEAINFLLDNAEDIGLRSFLALYKANKIDKGEF